LEGRRDDGFRLGQRIAKFSVIVLISVGIVEILLGRFTNSIGLESDGFDSISDAAVSLVVWLGLRFSIRSPDEEFNYGYLKVENLAAFIAAFGMLVAGTTILYSSYLKFLHPTPVLFGDLAIAVLLAAGSVSLYRAILIRRVANRYNLLSLKTDAKNSIKDASGSFIVAGAVLAATRGFLYMDAVGGVIVGAYIYSVAYVSMREASLVLLDSSDRPEVARIVRETIERKYSLTAQRIRLRRAGPYLMGTVVVLADEKMPLSQVHELKRVIEEDLRRQVKGIAILTLVFQPRTAHHDRYDHQPDSP
jgi:cation diffusion facilitator family transporter